MWGVAAALHAAEQMKGRQPVRRWDRVSIDERMKVKERAERLVRRPSPPTEDAELAAWSVALALDLPLAGKNGK